MKTGRAGTLTHDYKHRGTTTQTKREIGFSCFALCLSLTLPATVGTSI
jgi:hypothetical protein